MISQVFKGVVFYRLSQSITGSGLKTY